MDSVQEHLLLHSLSMMLPKSAPSRLEDLLDRSQHAIPMNLRMYHSSFDPNLPSKILKSLMSPADFVQLRVVSKAFNEWVPYNNALKVEMFKTLYVTSVHKVTDRESSLAALRKIGKFCEHLTIQMKEDRTTSTTDGGRLRAQTLAAPIQQPYNWSRATDLGTSAPSASYTHAEYGSDWALILKELGNVNTITISAKGEHKWNHFTQFEATLISIRLAIEKANLPSFHTIRLAPIHAYDILYCRLEGPGVYGEESFMSGRIWTRVDTLEVQIHYPFNDLSASEAKTFIKILHSWLRSFSPRLRVLKFNWVGRYNHDADSEYDRRYNPLLLDMVYPKKEFSAPPIFWSNLEELWLGNVKPFDVDLMELMKSRSPTLRKFNILHDLTRYDDSDMIIDFDDAALWKTLWCRLDPAEADIMKHRTVKCGLNSGTASSCPVPIPRPREGVSFDDPEEFKLEELKKGQLAGRYSTKTTNDLDGEDDMFPFVFEEL
ncbi:hypothetical protein AOQ84DRAFT_60580 [Glonium stellatum]|uniref:Uncharacterized protein n=1 Tax=Glonium stellatum TaxID=574774 RepID=A0A8E2EZS5_9PEZI|nr:hypothetical protein AOQ84DRAFT_60580 [Glonium stellatum]